MLINSPAFNDGNIVSPNNLVLLIFSRVKQGIIWKLQTFVEVFLNFINGIVVDGDRNKLKQSLLVYLNFWQFFKLIIFICNLLNKVASGVKKSQMVFEML